MRVLIAGLTVLFATFALAGCGGGGGGSSSSSGLVAYWPANGDYNDVVGGNNGTPYGGVTFAPGKFNEAFSFNGTSAAIFVPDSPSLAFTQSMAITAWINISAYASQDEFLFFRGDDRIGYDPYTFFITPTGYSFYFDGLMEEIKVYDTWQPGAQAPPS